MFHQAKLKILLYRPLKISLFLMIPILLFFVITECFTEAQCLSYFIIAVICFMVVLLAHFHIIVLQGCGIDVMGSMTPHGLSSWLIFISTGFIVYFLLSVLISVSYEGLKNLYSYWDNG